MIVAHHLGTPVQSAQKTTQIAHILESLGLDLNPVNLSNFSANLKHKKLDTYLASSPENLPESIFNYEDG